MARTSQTNPKSTHPPQQRRPCAVPQAKPNGTSNKLTFRCPSRLTSWSVQIESLVQLVHIQDAARALRVVGNISIRIVFRVKGRVEKALAAHARSVCGCNSAAQADTQKKNARGQKQATECASIAVVGSNASNAPACTSSVSRCHQHTESVPENKALHCVKYHSNIAYSKKKSPTVRKCPPTKTTAKARRFHIAASLTIKAGHLQ